MAVTRTGSPCVDPSRRQYVDPLPQRQARPLVLVLLTKKWEACVPYIQLLCVGGALYPLSLTHLNALAAQGRSDLYLRLEIIKKAFVVGAVAVTFRHGVKGLLIGDIVV